MTKKEPRIAHETDYSIKAIISYVKHIFKILIECYNLLKYGFGLQYLIANHQVKILIIIPISLYLLVDLVAWRFTRVLFRKNSVSSVRVNRLCFYTTIIMML